MHSSYIFAFSMVPRRRAWQVAILEQVKVGNKEPFELPWQMSWGQKDVFDIDLQAMVQTNTRNRSQRAIRPVSEIVGFGSQPAAI